MSQSNMYSHMDRSVDLKSSWMRCVGEAAANFHLITCTA